MDYQASMFVAWLLQLLLQVIVQIRILPGGTLASAVVQVTAVTFGLNLMPAYLDYKARSMSNEMAKDDYGTAVLEEGPLQEDNNAAGQLERVEIGV